MHRSSYGTLDVPTPCAAGGGRESLVLEPRFLDLQVMLCVVDRARACRSESIRQLRLIWRPVCGRSLVEMRKPQLTFLGLAGPLALSQPCRSTGRAAVTVSDVWACHFL